MESQTVNENKGQQMQAGLLRGGISKLWRNLGGGSRFTKFVFIIALTDLVFVVIRYIFVITLFFWGLSIVDTSVIHPTIMFLFVLPYFILLTVAAVHDCRLWKATKLTCDTVLALEHATFWIIFTCVVLPTNIFVINFLGAFLASRKYSESVFGWIMIVLIIIYLIVHIPSIVIVFLFVRDLKRGGGGPPGAGGARAVAFPGAFPVGANGATTTVVSKEQGNITNADQTS